LYRVKEIGLFGSFVRGEQAQSSDIDYDLVWKTIQERLPEVKSQIARILKETT